LRKKLLSLTVCCLALLMTASMAFAFFGGKFKTVEPQNGIIKIELVEINDGRAHYFKTRAQDGTLVSFFTLQSADGVIRVAIDACDVCYRAGKGYIQEGDFMVCENCGQKFPASRINVIKGGCNPAPLNRAVEGNYLVIQMADIDQNSWYCQFKNL
jgi:uncharacterized membrane protein